MRPVGFSLAALLAAAPAVFAQGPGPFTPTGPAGGPAPIATPGTGLPATGGLPMGAGVPAFPVSSTPVAPAAAPPADPRVTQHLKGWEDAMRGTTNFRSDFETIRTEPTFGKTTEFSGSVLCMKPNLARLRLVEKNKPGNYEAFICSGKAVYHYDGARKTMTQHMIAPNASAGGDNLMLDFLSGMRVNDALTRFDITLPKEPDSHYVYLLIKPKLPRDRQEFDEVRFAIYGPNLPATHKHLSYLPAQVFVKKPNGDTEVWKFKDPQTNLTGVTAKHFEYEAPPKEWTIQQAPPQSAQGTAPPMR